MLIPSGVAFAEDISAPRGETTPAAEETLNPDRDAALPDANEAPIAPVAPDQGTATTTNEPETPTSGPDEARSSTKESAGTAEVQSLLAQRLSEVGEPVAGGLNAAAPAVAGSLSSDNEAQYRDILNEVRLAVCLPVVNNHSGLSSKARSWANTIANRGWVSTQDNLLNLAPEAEWVAQYALGSYYWLSGYEFLGEAVYDYEVASWLADPELTDVGVGIVYGGSGYGSTNVTNFAGITKHQAGYFLDVRPWSKFYREINWMGTSGYSSGNRIEGCSYERAYAPKSRVSREAMAAFLYRLSGTNYQGPRVSPFSDVKPGDKFYNEIAWMYKTRLSTGNKVPNSKPAFAPKDPVSREAMAAFLYRFEKANYKAPATSPFSDIKPTDKFYREIAWMHRTGLSTGTKNPGGKPVYSAKDSVTREAMAAFIYRMKH